MKINKKIISFLIILNFFFFGNVFAGLNLIQKKIDGFNVKVVKIKLDGEHFLLTNVREDGDAKRLKDILQSVGSQVGITGGYFCPDDYPNCKISMSITYRTSFGYIYNKYGYDLGSNGILGLDYHLKPTFILNDLWYKSTGHLGGTKEFYNTQEFKNLYFSLANPVLLFNGGSILERYHSDLLQHKIIVSPIKSFICYTYNNKNIYFGWIYNINLYKLPNYLKKNFNCKNALLLDAGYSTGLYYKDKIKVNSPRKIMDAYYVLNKAQYKKLELGRLKHNLLLLRMLHKKDYKDFLNKYRKEILSILGKYKNKNKQKDINVYTLSKLNFFLKQIIYPQDGSIVKQK